MDVRTRRERRKRKKGVSPGVTIAVAALCSAVAFSGAYVYAMHTFNSKVTDLSEKQEMFTKLYEVDAAIRENYAGAIDEETLREALSSTYVKSIDRTNIIYVLQDEYDENKYKDYKGFKISDGSYVLIKKTMLNTGLDTETKSKNTTATDNTK
ncbi:MAG: hypothetical protein IJV39_02435 [Ruminococcus sp.]|nr:hypothetical protein [Ruminococcus sp.]